GTRYSNDAVKIFRYFSLFFFFSSRRRHTRSKRDWSSDVCSSDLHKFHDLVVSDIVKESAVVVHNRRDNPGRTVGWRGHHSTARGIFLVDSQRIQVDPFDTAQGIVGVTGTFRDDASGELLIQFGCPSTHLQTTRQRSFGALDAGLHTVLHDLPDVQDLRTDFFWLAPFNFVLPGQFCNRFALFLAHGQQLGGVAVIVFDFQVRAQWFIELLFG